MFDPNIRVRVIADFKYRDENFVVANSYLSFDIYDSTKISELVSLYNPNYSHKEFIELPSVDSLPFHVKEQLTSTYSLNKPKDQDYTPIESKPFYETLGDTFSPFGTSPHEDTTYDPKPLADNTYEPVIVEPKFPNPDLQEIKPSIAEEEVVAEKEVVINVEEKITPEYSAATKSILALSEDQLEDKSAAEIKKAVLELDKEYDYTNKVEAIKYIINFK
jgi:hypothetical protein